MAREARDHDHERAVVADLESELLLELRLADGLAGHVVSTVVRRDTFVGRGVERLGVDTVQDALKRIGAVAEHAVEALAVLGGLDLIRIGGAHRGDGVGVVERAHHVVDGVAVAAQLVCRRRDVGEAQDIFHHGVRELSLERHVMDREDRLDAVVEGESPVELAQEHGRESRLPIVAVQDVALEPLGQVLKAFRHGLREEGEALAVVEEAVGVVAREIALVVDEDVGHAIALELLEAAVLVAPSQAHIEIREVGHLALVLLLDGGVLGHHHDDLGSRAGERRGE